MNLKNFKTFLGVVSIKKLRVNKSKNNLFMVYSFSSEFIGEF